MQVKKLVELLQKENQEAAVVLRVAWAADTAITDMNDGSGAITVKEDGSTVTLHGWLSNCDTTLEIGPDDEEDEDEDGD